MVDLRRPWPFALFVVLAHVLSRFLGVSVHEILGHAASAWLLGGSAYGVYVSPGSGFTYVFLPKSLPPAGAVAMQGAGIAVEVAIGLLVWWWTRRSPSLAWRMFGLAAATVFVVYSLLYMAAGAFDFFPGDTWGIVSVLQNPALAYGFLAVGGLWTFLVGVFLSLDVARVFGGPGSDLRREASMVILFWLLPAPLAFLPGFAGFNALEASPVAYTAAFGLALGAVAVLLLYADLLPHAPSRPAEGGSWRPVAAVAVPLLLFVPLWLGVFGVSAETAKGVVLETPPVEAEGAWLGALAVNLEVVVHPDFNVTLYWRFRGTFAPASPLEAEIASTFEDRMDHDLYEGLGREFVVRAMNESSWTVVQSFISPTDAAWSGGREYPNARAVVLVAGPRNLRSFLADGGGGAKVLTVHDPFKYRPVGPSEGWLDALRIRWEDPLVPVGYAASGGTGNATRTVSANYVLWQSYNRNDASETYQVYLQPA